jgi:16S rRNA (cytosine967-C5)-methyltransferase
MVAKHPSENSRLAALNILLQVLPGAESPKSLNQLLQSDQNQSESPFTQAMVYGVCRYYRPLQTLVSQRLAKPLRSKDRDINLILLLGLYQILFSNKPAHAVLNQTTELARKRRKKWASGLVNGVLRGLQRDHIAGKLSAISPKSCLPDWLRETIFESYGTQQAQEIFDNSLIPAPMSLRHNPLYQSTADFERKLGEHKIQGLWSPITPECFTLDAPRSVNDIPGFMEGSCSVQDEAAQWATRFLDPNPNTRVLDACAAPGGKTGHLLEWARALDLTALDVSATRIKSVQSNLARLNHKKDDSAQASKISVIAANAADTDAWWSGELFDAILLDAPCSGTGVLRRHPDIFWLRRASDIESLVKVQHSLLTSLWQTLAPGGKLLYCTCSILPQENSHQIAQFLTTHPDATLKNLDSTPLAKSSKIERPNIAQYFGLQILPKANQHDGFYYALLTKSG